MATKGFYRHYQSVFYGIFREQCGHFRHDKKIPVFPLGPVRGQSIKYALIAGFLSILIIAGVNGIGTTVKGTFNSVANALQ